MRALHDTQKDGAVALSNRRQNETNVEKQIRIVLRLCTQGERRFGFRPPLFALSLPAGHAARDHGQPSAHIRGGNILGE